MRWAAHTARLDHVRIQCPLHQPFHLADFLLQVVRLLFKHADELVTDYFALLLRVGHAGEFLEEALACVHGHQVQAKLLFQVLLDFLKLILTQHTVVDEHADQPPPDGAVYKSRGDRRIHAARKRADYSSLLAHRLPHLPHALLDKFLRVPSTPPPPHPPDQSPYHIP